MTPQEKAIKLVIKFSNYACWGRFEDEDENLQNSKKCALIAVEELIEATDYYYWTEVKKEIEKL
jgi:hypothetical protein